MALDKKYIKKRYKNVSTSLIEITEDKLELILQKDLERVKKYSDISTPCSVFATLFIAVLTTDSYNSFLGVSGETWSELFGFFLFLSILYVFYGVYTFCKHKIEIKDIIEHIKAK